jgi:hypothetical protein
MTPLATEKNGKSIFMWKFKKLVTKVAGLVNMHISTKMGS